MPLNTAYIRSRREALKLTQQEAAERAGLGGKQRWYELEHGTYPNPSVETLAAVAKVLGCKLDKLWKE